MAILVRLTLGVVLLIAGIAIRIGNNPPRRLVPNYFDEPSSFSLSSTYDVLQIASWAALIVGALLVLTGLIGYWRADRSSG